MYAIRSYYGTGFSQGKGFLLFTQTPANNSFHHFTVIGVNAATENFSDGDLSLIKPGFRFFMGFPPYLV